MRSLGVANNASSIVGFLDIFSGWRYLRPWGFLALGILPFINASIIMQLLTAAIPSLRKFAERTKEKLVDAKISQITRYVALGWAIIQSTGFTFGLLLNERHYIENDALFPIAETSYSPGS